MAQNIEIIHKPRIAGLKFGIISTTFYRDMKDRWLPPPENPNVGYHVGLVADNINTKRFAGQLELTYNRKGASEVFESQNQTRRVRTKLNYAQLDVIPVVIKPLVSGLLTLIYLRARIMPICFLQRIIMNFYIFVLQVQSKSQAPNRCVQYRKKLLTKKCIEYIIGLQRRFYGQ